MWIFLNNAFVSAVEHRVDARLIMLRARKREDLERLLPDGYVIEETRVAEYRFRTVVSRFMLKRVLWKAVEGITYTNFKGSVKEDARHDAYMDVWRAMNDFQYGRYERRKFFGNPGFFHDEVEGPPFELPFEEVGAVSRSLLSTEPREEGLQQAGRARRRARRLRLG